MHHSAIYDPRRTMTPSQLAAAQAKATRAAKIAAAGRDRGVSRTGTFGTPRRLPAAVVAKPEPVPVYRMWFDDLIDAVERAMKRPSIRDVQTATARHFDLTVEDLMPGGREKHLVRARHIAMFIATRVCAQHSLPELGRRFGGFDHTTVMHARDRIAALHKSDAAVRADIDAILMDWPGVSI
ncbi:MULTISPECIES: helix-turn-helix domain-containing protein [unclassified Bradyrhizobium]